MSTTYSVDVFYGVPLGPTDGEDDGEDDDDFQERFDVLDCKGVELVLYGGGDDVEYALAATALLVSVHGGDNCAPHRLTRDEERTLAERDELVMVSRSAVVSALQKLGRDIDLVNTIGWHITRLIL